MVDAGPVVLAWWRSCCRARLRAEGALLPLELEQPADASYSDLCYSDLPYLYVGRGFAELEWPYSDSISVRDRYSVMEYPVGIAYYAWGAAYVTHWLSGSPNLDARGGYCPGPAVRRRRRCAARRMLFVAVNAVGFALCALLVGVVPDRGQSPAAVGRRALRAVADACSSTG